MESFVLSVVSICTSIMSCIAAVAAVVVALYVSKKAERPNVIAYLSHDRDKSAMYFVVKNVGAGIARNITIKDFDFSLVSDQCRPIVKNSFIERGIPTLVPRASRTTLILAGTEMANYCDKSCNITVSYQRSGFFRKYKSENESFALDYYSFSKSLYSASDLHLMHKNLEKIAISIEKMSKIQCQ